LLDKDIKKMALKYSLLSKFTSFFGRIKNKEKPAVDSKKVELPANMVKQEGLKLSTSQKQLLKSKREMITKYFPPDFMNIFKEDGVRKKSSSTHTRHRTKARINSAMKCGTSNSMKKKRKIAPIDSSEIQSNIVTKPLSEKDKFNYNDIINLQSIDGSFKSLPKEYEYLEEKSESVKSLSLRQVSDPGLIPIRIDKKLSVLRTLAALAILRHHCKHTKGEWRMIEIKALNYWIK
jgi:hypothetical protein